MPAFFVMRPEFRKWLMRWCGPAAKTEFGGKRLHRHHKFQSFPVVFFHPIGWHYELKFQQKIGHASVSASTQVPHRGSSQPHLSFREHSEQLWDTVYQIGI
jgi:hypothetical protein